VIECVVRKPNLDVVRCLQSFLYVRSVGSQRLTTGIHGEQLIKD
jgi:hypothetical protein